MSAPLGLFEGFGIELEYAIVDAKTLDVLPVCDRLLHAASGGDEAEIERGPLAWSNELALHVVELKTNGPAAGLEGLAALFQADLVEADALLAELGGRIMPGAMHPWMDPARETRLWPHEYGPVYQAFDRIFGCSGHGWSNLQSQHVNLPFANDEELRRLHAAVRLVLPILPGLAAASPVADGRSTGSLDSRLDFYRRNSARIPSVAGCIVPERVRDRRGYEEDLLGRIYRDLAPLDPDGLLRHEWVNARGAIVRFDRMALEIRLLDTQERPRADLAIAALVSALVKALVEERWCSWEEQDGPEPEELQPLLLAAIERGELAELDDERLRGLLGLPPKGALALGEAWQDLAERLLPRGPGTLEWWPALDAIFSEGTLARRLLRRLGAEPARQRLEETWRELCDCLREDRAFRAGG